MKTRRQRKILEIIRNQPIETQEELASALKQSGFSVTQATVSRDIKEMGLIKIPAGGTSFRYAFPGEMPARRSEERLRRLLRDAVVAMDHSENLLVIKTNPGEAQGVASVIDQTGWPEIIGTVAGDDTILAVVKPKSAVGDILKRFQELGRGN
ncbi:MAG: arginine repressor [Firmicutes bacterium]|nr:arginine repressor [Bacillota bacterium]